MRQRIVEKINKELKINHLEIIDKSHLHAGHLEENPQETHFQIIIDSDDLTGLTRVKAHQRINNLLKDEFDKGLHALEIKVVIPFSI
jgi:BolA protein